MLLIAAAVLAGVLAGLAANTAAGRTPEQITDAVRSTPLVEPWILVVGAAGAAAVGLNVPTGYPSYVLAASMVCVAVGALANRHVAGMTIVAVGTTANLVVLLANGFLPVDPQALVAAGLADADALDRVVLGVGRRLQSGGEVVPVLGPVIGVRWLREAFSIGDLVLAAGIANVCFRLLWPTGSAVRARSAPAPAPAKAEEIAYAAAPPVDRTPAALDDDPTAPLVFGLSAADGNAARRGVAR